jgi:hypothetical protein
VHVTPYSFSIPKIRRSISQLYAATLGSQRTRWAARAPGFGVPAKYRSEAENLVG